MILTKQSISAVTKNQTEVTERHKQATTEGGYRKALTEQLEGGKH